MHTRRDFAKVVGCGALGVGIGITTMGLSCESIFADIESYVPIGLAAFNEILSLVDPTEAALLTPIINDVKAAFADLTAAITQYENAPASDKSTLLGKITTAINAVIDEINQFWNDLKLPDSGLASTIEGVLQIILSTLAAFLPLIGGALLSKKKLAKTIPLIPLTKKQLGKNQVKASINACFVKWGHPDKQIY